MKPLGDYRISEVFGWIYEGIEVIVVVIWFLTIGWLILRFLFFVAFIIWGVVD